ncbi:MAG: DMT family transporter [Xanthobacteraceae bacterium]|nr:DMT family transporter [Xanthobacteraceae bacterium]
MPTSLSRNQRGVLAIVGCMASYTVNDVLVKQILRSYPVGEVIFVRGIMAMLLIGAVAMALGLRKEIGTALSPLLTARSAFDGLSTVAFITALAHMPLANVAAVLQIGPLLITVLAVLLFRESVGWRRWIAISIGCIGALFVIKPVPASFDIWAIVAAASALFAALRETANRRIGHGVPVMVVAFWGAVGITLFGAFFIVTESWRMLASADLFQLFIASVFVGIAIYLMALGFRDVDLSVVAPFRYTYLITSAVAGYLVFAELPDGWTVFGALLIVGSGIYTLHREAVRRRRLSAEAQTAA